MSLVAYGSSDDSDNSDVEDAPSNSVTTAVQTKTTTNTADVHVQNSDSGYERKEGDELDKIENGQTEENDTSSRTDVESADIQISDEEDDYVGETGTGGLNLPAPKHSTAPLKNETKVPEESNELLAGLPQPKTQETAKGLVDAEEGELEDFVKKKETPVEKPPPKKTKKAAVRITIPSLPDNDSDDDEEDEPKKKRLKPAGGSCGLFALLPAPKNVLTKEKNRSLVPHALTKKQPTKANTKPNKPLTPIPRSSAPLPKSSGLKSVLPGVPEADSDEEEEEGPSSFFSLGLTNSAPSVAAPARADKVPSTGPSSEPSTGSRPGPSKAEDSDVGADPADAPLQFKPMAGPSAFSGRSQAEAYRQSSWGEGEEQEVYTNQQYNLANQTNEEYDGDAMLPGQKEELSEEAQILRLQGKKAFGREAIQIIDVHQDDQIDRDELLKNLSQETGETPSVSHSRKNKDGPSSQQKRKHQITYLAFQAKQREVDLKNEWSENRGKKQATRNKYGF